MSSYVIAAPQALAAAAGDLTGIREAIRAATAVAAPSTTGIAAAAGDEVSAAIASLFGGFAEDFHALTAQTTLFHAQFVGTLSAAGAAYAGAEFRNVSLLVQGLQQLFFFDQGIFSPFTYLTGQPLFGKGAVGPSVTGATGSGGLGALIRGFFNGTLGAGSGGVSQGTGTPGVVTGVREGYSYVEIPVGPHGYDAPARWFFPTQANGTVDARGVIYLQHGFLGTGGWYSQLAIALAESTDSIVVVPTVSSLPLPGGAWLNGTQMQQGVGLVVPGQRDGAELQREPGRLPRHAAAKFHHDRTLGRRRPRHARRRRLRRGPRGEHGQQSPSRCGDVRRGGIELLGLRGGDSQPEDVEYPRLRGGLAAPGVERFRCHHERTGQSVPGAFRRGRAGQRLACRLAVGRQTHRRLRRAAGHEFLPAAATPRPCIPCPRAGSTTSTPGGARPTRYMASTGPPAATCPPAAS